MSPCPCGPVRPVPPIAPYQGGKRNLAGALVEAIDSIDHDCYAEPFVGMGGVFLRGARAPASEVINDLNRDVATLFRILQRHYVPFVEMMRFQLTTRAEFERLAATDPATLTDLERAARFLYLQRCTYGGKITGRTFGVSPDRPGRFDITQIGPILDALHTRLAGVVIECLPCADFLTRYDLPRTLFYLDPPYWGAEADYGRGAFRGADFAKLAKILEDLAGGFILSINDVPEIRRLFAWAEIREVATNYTIATGEGTPAAELIIMGGNITRHDAPRLL